MERFFLFAQGTYVLGWFIWPFVFVGSFGCFLKEEDKLPLKSFFLAGFALMVLVVGTGTISH